MLDGQFHEGQGGDTDTDTDPAVGGIAADRLRSIIERVEWTCDGFVPVCDLFYAALASKARGLILPR